MIYGFREEHRVKVPLETEVIALLFGAGLLFGGCGGRGSTSTDGVPPPSFPGLQRPEGPAQGSAQVLSDTGSHRLRWWISREGFGFRYNASQLSVIPGKSGKGIHLVHGPYHIAEFRLMDTDDLARYCFPRTEPAIAQPWPTLSADSVMMGAIRCTINSHASTDRNGECQLEFPPARISRWTDHIACNVAKAWFYFDMRWYDRPWERHPAGPIYFVDVSSPSRRAILEVDYDCSKLAPHWIESLLDSIVASVRVLR